MVLSGFGTVRESDYVKSQYLYMRPRPILAVLGVVVLGLFVWAATMDSDPFIIIFLVVVAIFFAAYTPWSAKRTYRNYTALSQPSKVEISDNGIFFESPTGSNLVPWSHFVKWRKNTELILIFPTPRLFHLLPRHFFEDDAVFESVAKKIEENLGVAT